MNGCLTLCDSIIHQASQSFIWVSQYFILSGSELKKRFPYFFKATMPDPIFSQFPRSLWLRFGRRWMAPRFCPRPRPRVARWRPRVALGSARWHGGGTKGWNMRVHSPPNHLRCPPGPLLQMFCILQQILRIFFCWEVFQSKHNATI